MTARRFVKVEGLANDFVLVDGRWETVGEQEQIDWWQGRAERLCHRRRGIGADGVLLVLPPVSQAAVARMVVINRDGSRPEMCGNGIRCVAHHVADGTTNRTVVVDSDAGPRACEVIDTTGGSSTVRVQMGPARIETAVRRFDSLPGASFHSVDMGNPHAVTFLGPDVDLLAMAQRVGRHVTADQVYPHGTNVEFVQAQPDGSFVVQVWERGVGITQACGTGACAVAAAAVATGHTMQREAIVVRLPGGTLSIDVPDDPDSDVAMTGPARRVFAGEIELDLG